MSKIVLDPKKLQKISQQLYGKTDKPKKNFSTNNLKFSEIDKQMTSTSKQTTFTLSSSQQLDFHYLQNDLAKIILFSIVAFAIQATLYFALQNNLIHLGILKF